MSFVCLYLTIKASTNRFQVNNLNIILFLIFIFNYRCNELAILHIL